MTLFPRLRLAGLLDVDETKLAAKVRQVANDHPLTARLQAERKMTRAQARAYVERCLVGLFDWVGADYHGRLGTDLARLVDLRQQVEGLYNAIVTSLRDKPTLRLDQLPNDPLPKMERLLSELDRELFAVENRSPGADLGKIEAGQIPIKQIVGDAEVRIEKRPQVVERAEAISALFEEAKQHVSTDPDVLEQPGMQGRPLPKRDVPSGVEPREFQVGKFSHDHAEDLIDESEMPRKLDPEFEIDRGPGVPKLRADRVDRKNRVIYEVKPDSPYWRAEGEKQLKIYKGWMDLQHPGRPWQTRLVTYDYKRALQTLEDWGYIEREPR
jgi:hypothetical protein